MKRTALGAVFAGTTLLSVTTPQPAWASLTTYTPAVKDYLNLAEEPSCTLCHESTVGGDGTATRPFGETVRSFGAIGDDDVGSLLYALELMDDYDIDSDEDGVHDLDELRAGYDPNNAMNHPALPPPELGEGGDPASDDDTDSASSNDANSGSGGTTSLEPSGAGGTRSSRPPPATRSNTIPEMKSGCAVTPSNSVDGTGTLLLFLTGLVGLTRGGRSRSRHVSLPA